MVALGKNWHDRPFRLSVESRMVALAAGQLMTQNGAAHLIFSGGHTAGPNHPSEAAAMYQYARGHKLLSSVPSDAVLLEEKSVDTADNAHWVRDLCRERGFRTIALVTTGSHLYAARRLFFSFHMDVWEGHEAEIVLSKRSHHHRAFLARYRKSCRYRGFWLQERMRRVLLTVDPEGDALRLITGRVRG